LFRQFSRSATAAAGVEQLWRGGVYHFVVAELNVTCRRLLFTVTPGRSGSSYLSKLLATVPSVFAAHEPAPDFADVFRRVQSDPDIAYAFLRDRKLPAIERIDCDIYAETSHLVCKGFIEPLIRMGHRPALIILRRPPRQVAWSLIARDTVPSRTPLGRDYLLQPTDPYVLPLIGWEAMSDYQLGFWYALEIERRQRRYIAMWRELNLPFADITNTELNDWGRFVQMLRALGELPITPRLQAEHRMISAERHNENFHRMELPSDLGLAEDEVWERIAHFEPFLRQHVEKRYERRPGLGDCRFDYGAAATPAGVAIA
jgi:hypothetical protein